MSNTHMEAKPLKPSMMLVAWATPVTQSTVKATANGV